MTTNKTKATQASSEAPKSELEHQPKNNRMRARPKRE